MKPFPLENEQWNALVVDSQNSEEKRRVSLPHEHRYTLSETVDDGLLEDNRQDDSVLFIPGASGSASPDTPRSHLEIRLKPQGKKPPSVEKIIKERSMEWLPGTFNVKFDGKTEGIAIDRETAERLANSAMDLTFSRGEMLPSGSLREVYYGGQASILLSPDGKQAKILTVMHNLCSEYNNEGNWEEIQGPHKFTVATIGRNPKKVYSNCLLPQGGWLKDKLFKKKHAFPLRNGVVWNSGKDIYVDVDVTPNRLRDPYFSSDNPSDFGNFLGNPGHFARLVDIAEVNQVVSDKFQYVKGMKICMAVFSLDGPDVKEEMEGGITPQIAKLLQQRSSADVPGPLEPNLIATHCGTGMEHVIFTGKITHVGDGYIENDMNSFSGCSGAAIFLFEEDHREYLRVIGVHAGYSAGLKANIGFMTKGISWE